MPYYLLPFIPIVFAPIFISLSDLKPKEKIFYSIYPLMLFILVGILNHKTRKPRSISFQEKGWYTIVYNVKNEMKLENKNGYREISFSKDPILLTSTKQMDIIPISESKYYYHNDKNIEPKKILFDSEVQYKENNQDTSLYIYFEVPDLDSVYCFSTLKHSETRKEQFFIGTIEEYLNRDSLYPIQLRNIKSNNFFKSYCEKNNQMKNYH